MSLDQNLNKILKEMWRLDEKLTKSEELTSEEEEFYKTHISVIKKYYSEQNNYWEKK